MSETESQLKVEFNKVNDTLDIKEGEDTLVILGRIDCPECTWSEKIIEEVIDKLKEDKMSVKFSLFFETQFEEMRDKLLQENLLFLEYASSPIIFINEKKGGKKIIGSVAQLLEFLKEKYGYENEHKSEEYQMETKENLKQFLSKNGNKYVYFNFEVDNGKNPDEPITDLEPVIFELFSKDLPKTAENFFQLTVGAYNENDEKLSYQDTIINRISQGSFLVGGNIPDVIPKSIYNGNFNDENYNIKHSTYGILGMVKKGNRNHTNECQFYITLSPLKCFDGQFVAFGRVIQGYDTIKKLAKIETYLQKPLRKISVKECGEYTIE